MQVDNLVKQLALIKKQLMQVDQEIYELEGSKIGKPTYRTIYNIRPWGILIDITFKKCPLTGIITATIE